jgi:hypothetical protein
MKRRKTGLFMIFFGLFFSMPSAFSAIIVGFEGDGDSVAIGTALIFSTIGVAITLIGLKMRFKPKVYLFVDKVSGLIVLFRKGRELKEIPFAAAGPLAQVMDSRTVRTKNGTRTVIYYCLKSPAVPDDFLFESTSELRTRREAEKMARIMNVSLISPAGEERSPQELDLPFYRRFARSKQELKATTLPFDSKLSVRDLMPGTEIGTSHRAMLPVIMGVLALAITGGIALLLLLPTGTIGRFGAEFSGKDNAYIILTVVLLNLGGYFFYRGIKSAFLPGKVVITPYEVSYRRTKMSLEDIEEIERDENGLIRLIGDHRILVISPYFCPDAEKDILLHVLRRAVIEAGIIAGGYTGDHID